MLAQWRKWIIYPILWLLFAFAAVVAIQALSRGETSAPMEAFDARYEPVLHDDRIELLVEERIGLELRGDRGIVRDFEGSYGDEQVEYTDFDVTNGDGEREPFEVVQGANGAISLEIGGDERKYEYETYVITYSISNVAVGNDDYQEVYFNTNGTGWSNGFHRFRVEVVFNDEFREAFNGDVGCYVGRAGSREECTLHESSDGFAHSRKTDRAADQMGIEPYENITVAFGVDMGTVTDPLPPPDGRSHGWWGIAILVVIGAVPLVGALVARRIVANLEYSDQAVVTEFDPPKNLLPVLAADFLGKPERGAAAHLTWLAVRGNAELNTPNHRMQPADNKADERMLKSIGDDLAVRWSEKGMRGYERRISKAVIGDPDRIIRFSSVAASYNVDGAQQVRDQELSYLGLRKERDLSNPILVIGMLALLGYGAVQIWAGLAGLGWWFLLAGVVATILLAWGVHLMPIHFGLTAEGKKTRQHLMGLQRFISTAESGRISFLENAASAPRDDEGRIKLHEELLPWAIVFGEEDSWIKAIGGMYTRLPDVNLRLPDIQVIPTMSQEFRHNSASYYERRRRRPESGWKHRHNFGEGGFATGVRSLGRSLSEMSSGRSSDSWSSRSSGRGWSGGRGGSRGGGSRGGGRSGGGVGGGGGGRR